MTPIPAVIELRQYTLHPGQRDVLIDLFERAFVAPQEALGLRVVGTFRDLDDADRFVWLRGFADQAMRPKALAAFYDGPVWARHRAAANATMVDSDNVLLLCATDPQAQVGAAHREHQGPQGV
ncbi:MAG: NIPSNAP family protein [Pseudomonadota bacterium]